MAVGQTRSWLPSLRSLRCSDGMCGTVVGLVPSLGTGPARIIIFTQPNPADGRRRRKSDSQIPGLACVNDSVVHVKVFVAPSIAWSGVLFDTRPLGHPAAAASAILVDTEPPPAAGGVTVPD